MDWDDRAAHHPEWNRHRRYHPQRAQGADGRIDLLWSNTIAFQKLQRLAHGDIDPTPYASISVAGHRGSVDRAGALHQRRRVPDFAPAASATEEKVTIGEWRLVGEGLRAFPPRAASRSPCLARR